MTKYVDLHQQIVILFTISFRNLIIIKKKHFPIQLHQQRCSRFMPKSVFFTNLTESTKFTLEIPIQFVNVRINKVS